MAAVFEQQCNNINEIHLTNDIQAFQARLHSLKTHHSSSSKRFKDVEEFISDETEWRTSGEASQARRLHLRES